MSVSKQTPIFITLDLEDGTQVTDFWLDARGKLHHAGEIQSSFHRWPARSRSAMTMTVPSPASDEMAAVLADLVAVHDVAREIGTKDILAIVALEEAVLRRFVALFEPVIAANLERLDQELLERQVKAEATLATLKEKYIR